MFGKLTSFFTTATASGVAVRDITMTIGTILAVLGILGFLSEDQVRDLTAQLPALMTAIGVLIAGSVSIYRIFSKSSSDKAAQVAKEVDAKVPVDVPVIGLQTPANIPDVPIRQAKA